MTPAERLTVRRAVDSDLPQIVDVCGQALGWARGGVDAELFRWKHVESPFGRSPIWVAEDTGATRRAIVGVRAMMRWTLVRPGTGGAGPERSMAMTRAVDTATLPSHQGRGVFTRLTMAAVDSLAADGVDAVFNTPNDRSRPGYLKMGWTTIGRVPVAVRPASARALATMARSRIAADKWGEPSELGLAPVEAFADGERIDSVIAATPRPTAWSTPMSAAYLRWRTSFDELRCRVEPLGSSVDDGFIVFRIRRRGALRQLSVLHVVDPAGRSIRPAIKRLIHETGADLAIATSGRVGSSTGMVPLPGAGPVLTWRTLASPSVPTMADLHLPLGAVELF